VFCAGWSWTATRFLVDNDAIMIFDAEVGIVSGGLVTSLAVVSLSMVSMTIKHW
jgi:hypothetical protein